jgi:hypothetical protein
LFWGSRDSIVAIGPRDERIRLSRCTVDSSTRSSNSSPNTAGG